MCRPPYQKLLKEWECIVELGGWFGFIELMEHMNICYKLGINRL